MAWAITASSPATVNNTTGGTLSFAVTTGDLIIVAVAMKDRSAWTVPTITDSASNTYTLINSIKHQAAGADVDGCAMYRAIASTTATITITLTATTAIYARWGAAKITGHNASSIVAASYSGEAAAYSAASLLVSASANNPSDALAIAMMSSAANDAANVASTGGSTVGTYTQLARSSTGSYFPAWSFDYQDLDGPASQAVQYTFSGYNEGASGLLVFINPAASGSTNDIEGTATLPVVGAVTASPVNAQIGTTGSFTLTVTVLDQYGTAVENATVTVTAEDAGVVTIGALAVTNSSGQTTSLIEADAAGNTTLTVACGGASTSVPVVVSGGGADLPILLITRR